MNINRICMNCMSGTLDEQGICSHCGEKDTSNGKRHLPVRTILNGRFLVGKVIGEGGFGITYIGYDLTFAIRVAIKEVCPKNIAGRDERDQLTVLPYDEESARILEYEKEKFIREARNLAKFRNEDGVVNIVDYFLENETAYIVMDYIEGTTLKNYLKLINKRIEWEELLRLLGPLMTTLQKMHEENILHRDINPDNIMIRRDRQKVYLIDFGTARNMDSEYTMYSYINGGYTPIEQVNNSKEQGPWTDVYALCATIYYCMSGKKVQPVTRRIVKDELENPDNIGMPIGMGKVLRKGLAINKEDRIQSIKELMEELYKEKELQEVGEDELCEEKSLQMVEIEGEEPILHQDASNADNSVYQYKPVNYGSSFSGQLLVLAVLAVIYLMVIAKLFA